MTQAAEATAPDPATAAESTARTGLVPDAYFSASKLAWIMGEVPGARARAEARELCFGTVDMAAPNGNVVVPIKDSIQNAQAILSEAQMEAPILMMGPPPVKNPEHMERLNKLNETYAGLCLDLGVAYLDLLKGLPAVYVADLDDGLHPGKTGNALIAEQLLTAPIVQSWLQS